MRISDSLQCQTNSICKWCRGSLSTAVITSLFRNLFGPYIASPSLNTVNNSNSWHSCITFCPAKVARQSSAPDHIQDVRYMSFSHLLKSYTATLSEATLQTGKAALEHYECSIGNAALQQNAPLLPPPGIFLKLWLANPHDHCTDPPGLLLSLLLKS